MPYSCHTTRWKLSVFPGKKNDHLLSSIVIKDVVLKHDPRKKKEMTTFLPSKAARVAVKEEK